MDVEYVPTQSSDWGLECDLLTRPAFLGQAVQLPSFHSDILAWAVEPRKSARPFRWAPCYEPFRV